MIAVIDYGVGNVGSIINMLKKLGIPSVLTCEVEEIVKADKIILPGVGSFDVGMQKLKKSGLIEILKKHALIDKKPMLGICLGMQMLGISSEEGIEAGLNFIPFVNKKFVFDNNSINNNLKIPHMGWDLVYPTSQFEPILSGLDTKQRYYFVHSFYAICENTENIILECNYGFKFAAAVKKGNIYGVQFHPEKSHKYGMALLKNFSEID